MASILADLPILWRMLRGRSQSADHAQSLEDFYAPQAQAYDRFRERLLHGRSELVGDLLKRLPAQGASVVELGCGTGRNWLFFGDRLRSFSSITGVDLCPSLLKVAEQRITQTGWKQAQVVAADATTWLPPTGPVDAVLMSYSLSMIPDWQGALANAKTMLKPGGILAVVDFHRPEKGWLDRSFWPWWFRHDGVHLRSELLPAIKTSFSKVDVVAGHGAVPWTGLKAPMIRILAAK
jgi:S-adenosylmethionine-diacylgycerolhomoserine-N-methlytransferase